MSSGQEKTKSKNNTSVIHYILFITPWVITTAVFIHSIFTSLSVPRWVILTLLTVTVLTSTLTYNHIFGKTTARPAEPTFVQYFMLTVFALLASTIFLITYLNTGLLSFVAAVLFGPIVYCILYLAITNR